MQELKPIRSEAEHAEAMRTIDGYLERLPETGTLEADRLEALSILVHAYEQSHPDHRIEDKIDPVETIKFHMERLGRSNKDLAGILNCSRPRVWEILNRKRALTLPQIRALSKELNIPADRLIAEYPLKPRVLRKASGPLRKSAERHSCPPVG